VDWVKVDYCKQNFHTTCWLIMPHLETEAKLWRYCIHRLLDKTALKKIIVMACAFASLISHMSDAREHLGTKITASCMNVNNRVFSVPCCRTEW